MKASFTTEPNEVLGLLVAARPMRRQRHARLSPRLFNIWCHIVEISGDR